MILNGYLRDDQTKQISNSKDTQVPFKNAVFVLEKIEEDLNTLCRRVLQWLSQYLESMLVKMEECIG